MSKRYGHMLTAMVAGLTVPQRPWRRAYTRLRVANALAQAHTVTTRRGPLTFVSTHPEALQYPRDLEQREPETIEWIDAFETPCRFWDIGANVGAYALYAGLHDGVSVLAFEPSPATYAALCGNVETNGMDERIKTFCVALSDETKLGTLNMSATHAGNSFNSFESAEDCFGRALAVRFRQSTVGFALDDFRRLFGLPTPHYVKVDVDGVEAEILDGARETLRDTALRSLLIELEYADTARNTRIVERLEAAGFVLDRRGADHAGSANAIFVRRDASSA